MDGKTVQYVFCVVAFIPKFSTEFCRICNFFKHFPHRFCISFVKLLTCMTCWQKKAPLLGSNLLRKCFMCRYPIDNGKYKFFANMSKCYVLICLVLKKIKAVMKLDLNCWHYILKVRACARCWKNSESQHSGQRHLYNACLHSETPKMHVYACKLDGYLHLFQTCL